MVEWVRKGISPLWCSMRPLEHIPLMDGCETSLEASRRLFQYYDERIPGWVDTNDEDGFYRDCVIIVNDYEFMFTDWKDYSNSRDCPVFLYRMADK